MRRPAYTVSILSAAILLAGCTTASGTAAPIPQPTSTASSSALAPTLTATPTPTSSLVEDPADPSTWIVTEEGIGPIKLNAPFSDAVDQLPTGVERDLEVCRHSVWWKDANGDQLVVARDSSTDDAGPLELVSWRTGSSHTRSMDRGRRPASASDRLWTRSGRPTRMRPRPRSSRRRTSTTSW